MEPGMPVIRDADIHQGQGMHHGPERGQVDGDPGPGVSRHRRIHLTIGADRVPHFGPDPTEPPHDCLIKKLILVQPVESTSAGMPT